MYFFANSPFVRQWIEGQLDAELVDRDDHVVRLVHSQEDSQSPVFADEQISQGILLAGVENVEILHNEDLWLARHLTIQAVGDAASQDQRLSFNFLGASSFSSKIS